MSFDPIINMRWSGSKIISGGTLTKIQIQLVPWSLTLECLSEPSRLHKLDWSVCANHVLQRDLFVLIHNSPLGLIQYFSFSCLITNKIIFYLLQTFVSTLNRGIWLLQNCIVQIFILNSKLLLFSFWSQRVFLYFSHFGNLYGLLTKNKFISTLVTFLKYYWFLVANESPKGFLLLIEIRSFI